MTASPSAARRRRSGRGVWTTTLAFSAALAVAGALPSAATAPDGTSAPDDPAAHARLGRELAAMRRVRDRHIARVLDADLAARRPYLVTEFVDGAALDGVVVVLNASGEAVNQLVPGLAGEELELSPVQAAGADEVVKGATWDAGSGTASVPARTVAVFVQR